MGKRKTPATTPPAPPVTQLPPGMARDLYDSVASDFELTPPDEALLLQACWCLHRVEQAREQLEKDGLIVLDRNGIPREHPAAASERQYGNQARLFCRELGLVLEPTEKRMPSDRTYHR